MTLNITFTPTPRAEADTVIVYVYEGKKPGAAAQDLDKQSGGLIKTALKTTPKFAGKTGETLVLALPQKAPFSQALLLGLGKPAELNALKAETAGGKLVMTLGTTGARKAVLFADKVEGMKDFSDHALAAHIVAGVKLRSYKFERYKSKVREPQKTPENLYVTGDVQAKAATLYNKTLAGTIEGVFTARDLVNEPPNHLYPEEFARFVKSELGPLGVEVTVLDEKKMTSLGMGAIMAVGQGSARQPRMVMMHWKGGAKQLAKNGQAPVALVGKGVTFDTGGISIKPAASMDEMKMDMGGAAAVVGTIQALAQRKSKAHVIGVIGLAENMISGNAYRPSDIIKSYAGKTIEVLNTDAEGRLVLADALTYVQRTYKPRVIIDLATLTGAMMVALGHEYCGTFANDDKLWAQMEKASAATGEKLWRMPLDEAWKKEMESPVADLQNLGQTGRYAGACTAAGFLEHFIEGNTPWAHMDIAGTAWSKKDKPTVPKFGSGFGVRLLERLIADHYE